MKAIIFDSTDNLLKSKSFSLILYPESVKSSKINIYCIYFIYYTGEK